MAKNLELVIRCKDCGADVDTWYLDADDLDADDPATQVCEIAGELHFEHRCPPKSKRVAEVTLLAACEAAMAYLDVAKLREHAGPEHRVRARLFTTLERAVIAARRVQS